MRCIGYFLLKFQNIKIQFGTEWAIMNAIKVSLWKLYLLRCDRPYTNYKWTDTVSLPEGAELYRNAGYALSVLES